MNFNFINKWHVFISEHTRWTTLAKVGKIPAVRLTMLIPFIGIFLIFNEQTEKLVVYPEFFREDLGIQQDSQLPVSQLYFTYFGLCFLGVASAMFAVFCPREISNQPNQQKFLLNLTSLETPVIAKGNLRELLHIHFDNESIDEKNHLENPKYPDKLDGDFQALMEEIYTSSEIDDEEELEDFPEVMTASGYLDFTEFARMLWMNQRCFWPYTIPVFSIAPKFAKDIAFLKYQAQDYTRYSLRFFITLSYFIGFLLLLVPTMRVFLLLGWTLLF